MRLLLVRNLVFLTAIVAVCIQSREASAQVAWEPATAIYYAASGDVVLDWGDWPPVGNMQITGPGVPFIGNPDPMGGFVDASIPGEVSWLFFVRPPTGTTFLGILKPNLSISQLNESFAFNIDCECPRPYPIPWHYVSVPEPNSALLATAPVIGLWARRRRAMTRHESGVGSPRHGCIPSPRVSDGLMHRCSSCLLIRS